MRTSLPILAAYPLDIIRASMRLEEALDITIGDDESEGCTTVADALRLRCQAR